MAKALKFVISNNNNNNNDKNSFQNSIDKKFSWNFISYNNKNTTKYRSNQSSIIRRHFHQQHNNNNNTEKGKISAEEHETSVCATYGNSDDNDSSSNSDDDNISTTGQEKQQQQQQPKQQQLQHNRQQEKLEFVEQARQRDRRKLTSGGKVQGSYFITDDDAADAATISASDCVLVSAPGCVCATMTQAAVLELKQKYQIISELLKEKNKIPRSNSKSKVNRSKHNGSDIKNNNRNNNNNNNSGGNNNNNNNISSAMFSSFFDQRNIFYVTVLVAFYCCILIHASVATAANNNNNSSNNNNNNNNNRHFAKITTTDTAQGVNNVTTMKHAFIFDEINKVNVRRPDNNQNKNNNNNNNNNYNNNNKNNNQQHNFHLKLPARNLSARTEKKLHQRLERDAAKVPDEEDDYNYHDDELDEIEALLRNKSAKGKYIGAPCDNNKCEDTLLHVSCDQETQQCGCEKNYPVQLGLTKGCAKPKKLGEQCFYDETCLYNDENSLCVQVKHNARCQCASGFHSVSYSKPTRRVFCTQDLKELKSDLPTLLGVSTGIAVLAGLICMVLHLFSKTKYPRHRNFGDANLPPPIMYSNETGIPLTVQSGRPSSRSSLRSSASIGSYGNRRSSMTMQSSLAGQAGGSAGSKGILVSTSRTGSRRPSLASVHSTSSSVRSYSMMRFEKEAQQKEIRQEMKLRLARLQQQQQLNQNKPQIIIGDTMAHHHGALGRISMSTPSPLTPNSLDELLPSVDETQELFPMKSESSTILPKNTTSSSATTITTTFSAATAANSAYNGPCSSSNEAL